MKTIITIEFETLNMREVIEDVEGKEIDVSGDIEREMHNILKELMDKEILREDLQNEVTEDELTKVEGSEKLEDYGDVTLKVTMTTN